MPFGVFGCEHHSIWGGLTGREMGDLGSLLSLMGMKRPVCLKVTFESVGDETPGVFESHFLAFLQGVFPKIISRSVT